MRAGRAAIATKGDATKMRRLQCETSHKPRSEAPVTMTKTEITCGQEAVDFMKEPRMQQTNYNYEITSRQELLILIKVLLDDLEEKDPSLRAATAKMVQECVVRNRAGQRAFSPLVPVIQERVRDLVGDECWSRNVETVRKVRDQQARQTASMILARFDECPTQVAQV